MRSKTAPAAVVVMLGEPRAQLFCQQLRGAAVGHIAHAARMVRQAGELTAFWILHPNLATMVEYRLAPLHALRTDAAEDDHPGAVAIALGDRAQGAVDSRRNLASACSGDFQTPRRAQLQRLIGWRDHDVLPAERTAAFRSIDAVAGLPRQEFDR